MKKKRRGQVALEFLMTYGWAFLIILVVIGAFVYFDVLDPSGYVPDSCRFPAGIGCIDAVATTNTVTIQLRNGMGTNLAVSAATLDYFWVSAQSADVAAAFGAVWSANQVVEVSHDISAQSFNVGDRFMGTLVITYTPAGSSVARTIEGSVSLQVYA